MTSAATTLPGFPSGIPVRQETFQNWDESITVPNMWTCEPRSEADVVDVCNWAVGAGFKVRARGIMHNWSPLAVAPTATPGGNILLVDTTKSLNGITVMPKDGDRPAQVIVQTGATMHDLLLALQGAPGGTGAAPGYAFAHVPAPGHITVGGALAINAHGTAVRTPPGEDLPIPYGSLSNQILAFTSVVSEPESRTYVARTFLRGEGDDRAFLTHLGRAMLTSVTLQVTDNYNLRCQSYTGLTSGTLFQSPSKTDPVPRNSVSWFLEQAGRVEVIWFPSFPGSILPSFPWLKVWTVEPHKPASSTAVSEPYNYAFSDNLSEELSNLIAAILDGEAKHTPVFCTAFELFTNVALNGGFGFQNTTDLWGPSMNTLLYVKDTTLRVTANGYAVQMKKADVQGAVAVFTAEFSRLLGVYRKQGLYPINSPLEIRVTNLDDPARIVTPLGQPARTPPISSLTRDATAIENGWDIAVWFDVLTLLPAGDPQHANEFYEQLERWFAQHFADGYRVMPEWSKGWAYTAKGAWTNDSYIESIRQKFGADWLWEAETLARYDAAQLFHSPLLDVLFPGPIITTGLSAPPPAAGPSAQSNV